MVCRRLLIILTILRSVWLRFFLWFSISIVAFPVTVYGLPKAYQLQPVPRSYFTAFSPFLQYPSIFQSLWFIFWFCFFLFIFRLSSAWMNRFVWLSKSHKIDHFVFYDNFYLLTYHWFEWLNLLLVINLLVVNSRPLEWRLINSHGKM